MTQAFGTLTSMSIRFDETETQMYLYVDDEWVGYVSFDIGLLSETSLEIGWLKSFREGNGYARIIMEWVYERFSDKQIYWGECLHPASLHLAECFYDEHPSRTYYMEPVHEGLGIY